MKRICYLAALALFVAGAACCSREDRLRSGDLVFVGIPLDYSVEGDSMDAAIAKSTGDGQLNLIHVAIAEVEADSVFIIDATLRRGVDRHPLDTFLRDFTLKDGSLPVFQVMRLKDPKQAKDCIGRAKSYCGAPYDTTFLPDNGALYCSELVQDSYRKADGACLFDSVPMNWKDADGEIPEYWVWLFGRMGMEVPQGVPGTNPQEMAQSPLLRPVPVNLLRYAAGR